MKSQEKKTLLWTIEEEARKSGYEIICGVDEAGRGPLAGPVAAAACILPYGVEIEGLDDSKKISEKKREKLYDIIVEKAISYAVEFVSAEEIDRINILEAAQLAMRRAVSKLDPVPSLALVDGNIARDFPVDAKTVVGGDALSPSIAAASILAKVSRDRLLAELDAKYPEYGFAKHKGYPTKLHYEMIKEHGVLPEHRKSFLKNLSEK